MGELPTVEHLKRFGWADELGSGAERDPSNWVEGADPGRGHRQRERKGLFVLPAWSPSPSRPSQ